MIGPHCGDSAENKAKKSRAGAAGLVRLRGGAIDVGLLLGDCVFGLPDLLGAGGIGAATVEGGELAFELHTNRIAGRRV